jgi:DNA adenine methylase
MVTSPLRYPGGKSKLFGYFTSLIKENNLFGFEYCEPYAGGAGLALKLLEYGFVDSISLNDIDPAIYAFWKSVLENTENFCKMIVDTPITIEEWHKQQAVWRAGKESGDLALGFATFFLNRTNRSGIIDGAGPIGGYAQAGLWKLDVRLIKDKQVSNIQSISKFAARIELSNVDAMPFIKKKLISGGLLYLDPPYYVKGQKLYKNFYCHDDHVQIRGLLREMRDMFWVLSYDDVPQIRMIYKDFQPISYDLNYSAGRKAMGKEVVYLSNRLVPPLFKGFEVAA